MEMHFFPEIAAGREGPLSGGEIVAEAFATKLQRTENQSQQFHGFTEDFYLVAT
jgi:hypothetical protein